MNDKLNKFKEKISNLDRKILIIGGIVIIAVIIALCIALGNKGKSKTAGQTQTEAAGGVAETAPPVTAPDGSIFKGDENADREITVLEPDNHPTGYVDGYNGEELTGTWKETTVGTATMELREDGSGEFTSAGVKFTWYAENTKFIVFYDPMYGSTVPSQYDISVVDGKVTLTENAEDGAIFVKD